MNKKLLHTDVQKFIDQNLQTDIVSILLKKSPFNDVSSKELAQQIESKKKCKKKLPTWFSTSLIFYPKKINIEQTSSEVTAAYKSKLVKGIKLVDLTGGLGIDSYFFSKKVTTVFYCEIDENLTEIAAHNFNILGIKNIQSVNKNGLTFLEESDQKIDWIYIDPSRRNEIKGKVFQLSDCVPNVPVHLETLFEKSKNILIKTSPLLDISVGIKELKFVKEIHIVAVENEVKELLWLLEKEFIQDPKIQAINFSKKGNQVFKFSLPEEQSAESKYSFPLRYLYEPNSAVLKSGAFKSVGTAFSIHKLHQHTHLYTSEKLLDFPGRRFKIEKVLEYNKNALKELKEKKVNITTRNFPESVALLRKKFKIKDGGNLYAFFTQNLEEKYCVILCSKI